MIDEDNLIIEAEKLLDEIRYYGLPEGQSEIKTYKTNRGPAYLYSIIGRYRV